MKRALSLFLTLLMVFSLFTGLNISATAVEAEFADTGAETDITDTGAEYNLWLGSTQVTDANKDDILGDGGRAKFNPSTNTLTLNDPTITGSHSMWPSPDNRPAKIAASIPLTIKGSYHMTSYESVYGIGIRNWNTLTLDGDFTIYGQYSATYCDGNIVLESGTLESLTIKGIGLESGGRLIIHNNVEKLHIVGKDDLWGALRSVYEPDLCASTTVTAPENGVIQKNAYVYSIFDSSGNLAFDATIEVLSPIGLDGRGKSADPYLIKSAGDWNKLSQYIADGGETSGDFYKLTNDITVKTSLGTSENPFSGTFNGDGHTMTLDNLNTAPFCIGGATIVNLTTDGSVSGGRHVSGLVGGIVGSEENFIGNCQVAATITSNDTYCGGFVGHGGSQAKTVLFYCVFSGTLNGSTAGTFWGWSDKGSTPELDSCIDVSDSNQPIGRGEPKDASVTNCYYTKDGKETGGGRPWSNQGKRAYTVSGDGVTLNGAPGIRYNGTIYAGEGDQVSLTVSNIEDLYNASAGTLERNGSNLILTMPAKDVTVAKSENAEPITGYSNAVGTGGNKNEGAENFVDGKTDTKWCYSSSKYPLSITFRSNDDVTPYGYILTTANDTKTYPERNPISWKLEGSADGQNWTTLSDVSDNTTFEAKNYTSYTFPLNNPDHTAFSYYRFTVKGTVGGGTFQLSEFQLIGKSVPVVEYDLWLGSTRVTSRNKNDILNDGGRAKFDPETNTLTLNEPTITGLYKSDRIHCEMKKIIIKGNYHMAEDDFSAPCGFYCDNDVTLAGDFTFVASIRAIAGCAPLTIRSGSVKFISQEREAVCARGALNIKNNVTRFEAVSRDEKAIYTAWFSLGNLINVTTPENGVIKEHKVYEADGETPAKHVVLDRAPEVGYSIWLGDTQVTNYNQDDILNDGGKAKFDPETNTLTLDNPTITGSHGYATIYADHVIVFKGTYHMTNAVDRYGVYAKYYIEFRGDFTFMGTEYGVYAEQYSKILSGSLKAVGGTNGYYGWWETTIGRDITRFEADGVNAAYDGNYLLLDEGLMIVEPEGGYLSNGKRIKTAGGSIAKHAVIVPKPIILGDVDGDGEVEIRDATWIQRHVAEIEIPFEIRKKTADVNGDGEITVMDATAIQYYLANMKNPYNIGRDYK